MWWRQDTWWHVCAASRSTAQAALWRQTHGLVVTGVITMKMCSKITSYDTAWCGRSVSTFRKNILLPLGKTNDTNRRGKRRANWRLCAKGFSELERGPAGLWWDTTNAKMEKCSSARYDARNSTVMRCSVRRKNVCVCTHPCSRRTSRRRRTSDEPDWRHLNNRDEFKI